MGREVDEVILRCMRVIPGREYVDLSVARETAELYESIIGKGVSDLEYAQGLTPFVHRGSDNAFGDTCIVDTKDNSRFSAYDVFRRILTGEPKTGSCFGTTQSDIYLLNYKGIESRPVFKRNHVFLEARIEGSWIPIETTMKDGFGFAMHEDCDVRGLNSLEAAVWNMQGKVFESWDVSIANFTKAIGVDPQFEQSWYNRGDAHNQKGALDLAMNDYVRAVKINPDFAEAHYKIGSLLDERGELDFAVEKYTKAIDINPKFEEARYSRAMILMDESPDLALKDFREIVRLNSRHEDSYYSMAYVLSKTGDFASALEACQKYALFSSENARRVEGDIKDFKMKLAD